MLSVMLSGVLNIVVLSRLLLILSVILLSSILRFMLLELNVCIMFFY